MATELSDAEVFNAELSDADIFGAPEMSDQEAGLTQPPGAVSRQVRSVLEAPVRFERGLGEKIGDVASGAARVADIVREGDVLNGAPTPAPVTMRQRRKAYVAAMSDPQYGLRLSQATTREEADRVEALFGAKAKLTAMRFAEEQRAADAAAASAERQTRLEASSPTYQWGREQAEFSRRVFAGSADIDDTFISELSVAAGGMLPDVALSAVPVAGPALAATSYGLQAGEQQAQEAVAAGRPDRADIAFVSAAGLGAGSERVLGVAPGFWKAVKASRAARLTPEQFGTTFKNWVARNPVKVGISKGMVREGMQEGAEQAGQNLIASDVAGYDPDRPLLKDVPKAALLGSTMGGIAGGASVKLGQLQQAAADVEPPPSDLRPLDDELPPAPPAAEEFLQSTGRTPETTPRTENVPGATAPTAVAPEQSDGPTPVGPEDPRTIAYQMDALQNGKRSAVLITEGEAMPEVPGQFKTVALEGYGTMIYNPRVHREETIVQRAKENKLGRILGYGVDRKPKPGTEVGVVTVRDPQGVEKQAVVTDQTNLDSVVKAAEKVAEPQDTVQLEQPEAVIADRRAETPAANSQLPTPQVTESHLQQARSAVAQMRGEERPPDILDDLEANVTRGPVQFPTDMQDALDASRERVAEALHKKPWKRLTSAQRKAIDKQLRVSTAEGLPADQALTGIGEKYAGLSADDFANAILDAGEARLLQRQKGDSKEVLAMAQEIAAAESEAGQANEREAVTDFDQAAEVSWADKIDATLTRAIEASDPWQQQRSGELHLFGLPKFMTLQAYNGMVRVIRATFRGTRSLAQAVQAGIDWLKTQNLPNFSETEIRTWLDAHVTVTPEDDDINVREFIDQLSNPTAGEPDIAQRVRNLLYERRTNESDAAFAARVLQAVGGPAAAVDVFTDGANGLPGSVRMMLGQLIIKAFGVAGQHDAAARFYDETFAAHITDTAQSLQALSAFLALTPEGKLIWARRKIERAAQTIAAPLKPQSDAAQREIEQANQEGIEAATASKDVQAAAREAVDAALEKQAATPGTDLANAIRQEVLDGLVKAGLLTAREAEIAGLHYEGTADNSTLADKLKRAGIPLHEERARLINQLYKARTDAERKKILAAAARARNPKPAKQRYQPGSVQEWIAKARSIPSREIEAAAARLRRALEPASGRRSPALQEFYQRLTTRLKALLPEPAKASAQPLTDAQLIREVFNNPEKYAEVWAQLGTEIRAKYGVEGLADVTNTLGELSPERLVEATMQGNLDRIIRETMQALRVQFGQLIRSHYTQQAATTATLKDRIVQSVGLSEADASKLALVVQKRFAQLVTDRKRAALEKLLKPVPARTRPQLIERLITATNLGALSQERFWQAVQNSLDLPQWSNELADRIRKQVDVIERIPADQVERKQKAQIELLNIIERAKGIDALDLGIAFYVTNVLTGFTTHAKNIGSTFLNATGTIGVEAARAVASGNLSDIPLVLEAIGQGVKRGKLAAGDVLRTGQITGSRLGKVEAGRALELTQFGQRGGVPVRGKVTRAVLENRLASILNLWKYNFRIMAAEDLVFFKPAEEAKAALLAKRIARSEGLHGDAAQDRARQILGYTLKAVDTARAQAAGEGLTGNAAARRVAEILNNNRPLELREDVRQFALRTTFNNEPYGALGAVAQLLNRAKASENAKLRVAANLITPFTNIIANVVNESLNYTPVGALRARYNGDQIVGYERAKLTPAQQADLRAELYSKALVGTVLLSALALKAAGDLDDPDPDFAIYGTGPAAATDRMGLEAKGWLAHSFKIGGRYYSYANTPLAIPLAWLGGISDRIRDARLFQNRRAQRTAESLTLMAASAAIGMGKVITEQSFMTGLMDLAQTVSEPSPEASGRGALKQVVRTASSVVVPNAVRQVDKFFDPTQYEQRTAEGIVVNAIPFVRAAAGQPVLNALGLPVQAPLSKQFTSSQADADPIVKTLAETGNWPTLPNRNEIYPATGRTMTDAEYYDYVKGSGATARKELTALFAERGWRTLDTADQAKMISETVSLARQMWRADHGW